MAGGRRRAVLGVADLLQTGAATVAAGQLDGDVRVVVAGLAGRVVALDRRGRVDLVDVDLLAVDRRLQVAGVVDRHELDGLAAGDGEGAARGDRGAVAGGRRRAVLGVADLLQTGAQRVVQAVELDRDVGVVVSACTWRAVALDRRGRLHRVLQRRRFGRRRIRIRRSRLAVARRIDGDRVEAVRAVTLAGRVAKAAAAQVAGRLLVDLLVAAVGRALRPQLDLRETRAAGTTTRRRVAHGDCRLVVVRR